MGKPKKRIPDGAVQPSVVGPLSEIENKIFGFDKTRDEVPHVNLKYIQTDFECFSAWAADELKDLSSFINKLSQSSWTAIFKTGASTGHKVGLGMTYHKDRDKLPEFPVLDSISPDINFFELRVNQKVRVHGFRSVSAFFLVWLDREHRIYPC